MKPNRHIAALDGQGLERLALRYVERYATTRSRLRRYLERKLKERGWAGTDAPPLEAIVTRMAELRYVDDAAFAEMRAASLLRHGYGARRIADALRAAGVDDCDRPASDDGEQARASALAFARRKRIGPFARSPENPDQQRRAFAAMMRAGHSFSLVREILGSAAAEHDLE